MSWLHKLYPNRSRTLWEQNAEFFTVFLVKRACEMWASIFGLVCCAFLRRGLRQCYSHGCLGILILSAPLEQCRISICSAVIIIYISQHLFHLDRFNYNNRNGALWTKTTPRLIKAPLLTASRIVFTLKATMQTIYTFFTTFT